METEDRRSYELRKEFIAMLDELRQMRFEDDSSRNNLIALFSISRTHALGDNNLEQFSSSIGLDTLSFSTNNETSEDIKNIDTTIGYSKDSSSITLCSNQHRVYDVIVEEQNLSYATHPDPDIAIDVEYDFSFVSDGDYDSPADNEDQQGEILKEVTVDIQQSFVVEENHFTLGLISNYLLNPIHSLGKISNQIAGYFPNSKLVRSAKFTNKNKRRSISNSTTNKQYSCPNYYSTEQFTLTNDPIVLNISVEGLEEFKDLLQKDFVIHHFLANVNKIDSIHDLQEHNTLESISISDNKIENIDELCNLKNLLLLNVDINRISKLKCIPKQLRAFTGNYNRIDELLLTSTQMLTRLELFSNRLSTVSLKSLPNLTYLDLGNNHFEDIDGHIFSNCHLLHTLILSQNKLTRAPVLSLPNLSTLKLNGNLLTNLSTWRVYKDKLCSYLPKLRKLFIQDNLIDSFHRGIFSYMLSLQEVDASFNKISHTDNLLGLWELPLCTVVKLNDNPFITNNIEIRKQFLFSLRYSCSPLEMSFLVRPEIFSERFRYKPFNVQAFRNTSYSQPFSSSHFPSCHSKACDLYNLRDDVAVAAMKKKKYSYEKLATLFCDQSVHTNSIGFVRLLSTLSNTNYQQHDFICLKQKLENSGSLSLVQRQKVVVSFDPTKYHKAATIIQSYFRGTKTRRRMKELMSSVKYVDAELDDLLADDISFDYGEDESEVACLVYGDHIKKRSQIRDIPSRPSSATSDTSAVTISSGVLPDDNASDEGYVAGENLARMVSPRNSLAEDWGIKDPKLLATFMKRNKRIR